MQSQLNTVVRVILHILVRIGPATFRRKIVEMLPRDGASQHMMRISDNLTARSLKIVSDKKEALQQGDAALKQQVGEGKDIMSVLCESIRKHYQSPEYNSRVMSSAREHAGRRSGSAYRRRGRRTGLVSWASLLPPTRVPKHSLICSTLVLAATDTTSNALARIFHQLCLHPDVQQRLREEIIQARDDGTGNLRDLDYDEVMELPFLDAVCRETMRR